MWTCPKCGEALEFRYGPCRKCDGAELRKVPQHSSPLGWHPALWLGFLFEAGLLGLPIVLPHGSWAYALLESCLQISHLPLYRLLEGLGDAEWLLIPAVMLSFALMVFVWALLLRWLSSALATLSARLGLSGKQRRVLWWCVGCLALAGVGFKIVEMWEDKPVPFTSTRALKAVVEGNTTFALDLYNNLKGSTGNIFFSPFSISTGLAMTYAGARRQTASELARGAHFGVSAAELYATFGELSQRLEQVQHWGKVKLVTANGLWAQEDHPFLQPFMDTLQTSYRAEARNVDFKHDCPRAVREMNSWMSKQTGGRITGMLDSVRLDESSRLVLCNAIYFKGKWKSRFRPGDTHPAPFQISPSESVSVPMMVQTAEFKMDASEPEARMLELPYYGGDLGMVIILPYAVDGLAELEDALTPEKLDTWLANLEQKTPHKTHVYLPRFTTRESLDLKPILCAMGMGSPFGGEADLTGMDGIPNNLYLSDALHQAFVEVSESGTEAAAVTLMQAKSRGGPSVFSVDHPCLFLIREHGSGTILFLGRLVDPRS
jgi:serpin B